MSLFWCYGLLRLLLCLRLNSWFVVAVWFSFNCWFIVVCVIWSCGLRGLCWLGLLDLICCLIVVVLNLVFFWFTYGLVPTWVVVAVCCCLGFWIGIGVVVRLLVVCNVCLLCFLLSLFFSGCLVDCYLCLGLWFGLIFA